MNAIQNNGKLKFSKLQTKYFAALFLVLLLAIAAFNTYVNSNSANQPITAPSTTNVSSVLTFTSTLTIPPVSNFTQTSNTTAYSDRFIVNHVMVILLENENESYIIGNKNAPYINKMLIPNYSIAEKYYALGHPSLPNYIAITSGSTFGIKTNDYFTELLQYTNIVDLFSEHNITWKAYMESMPIGRRGSCNTELGNAGGTYGYFTKHNPFVYYSDIMNNLTRCSQIVPLKYFSIDLANNQLPEFSFITPNILDDGHTSPPNNATCPPSGTALQCADNWLHGFLPKVINSSAFNNTIVFITWDESLVPSTQISNTIPSNNVLLIAVSPDSKKGFAENTTFYSHYSLLATIEEIYGLGNLGRNDTTANVLNNLFVNNTI